MGAIRKNHRGFSVIELMMVVAIVAIIASIALPQYDTVKARAWQSERSTIVAELERSIFLGVGARGAFETIISPGNSTFTAVMNPPAPLSTAKKPFIAGLPG